MPVATKDALPVLTPDDVRQYERDGYFVARGLFSPDEVAEIRDTFMAQAKDGPIPGLSDMHATFGPGDPLAHYPRMMHPHRHMDKPVGPLATRHLLDARVHAVLT